MKRRHQPPRTLKAVRLAMNLTQADVARKTRLHRSIISRLDRGTAQPSIDTAEAIERGLGLKPGTLKFPKPSDPNQGVAA
jgi:transcriptional regulator with XRE-family HTH domain